MARAPSALHGVAAWCAAILFLALAAIGTREVVRALAPGPPPVAEPEVRVEPRPPGKQPYVVIEGRVHSRSGTLNGRIDLEVDHPGGATATTQLHFDRPAPSGDGLVAPFKLIKPAPGTYVLCAIEATLTFAAHRPDLAGAQSARLEGAPG